MILHSKITPERPQITTDHTRSSQNPGKCFFLGGGKCPNLGVVNVRILGGVNVRLANNLTPILVLFCLGKNAVAANIYAFITMEQFQMLFKLDDKINIS